MVTRDYQCTCGKGRKDEGKETEGKREERDNEWIHLPGLQRGNEAGGHGIQRSSEQTGERYGLMLQ